jgi:exodeoxyribonuclease VII small subunit
MAKSKAVKSEFRFEQALSRLEEIVSSLESGEASLEEAIILFEEGSQLSKLCQDKLSATQAKIEKLVGAKAGPGEMAKTDSSVSD